MKNPNDLMQLLLKHELWNHEIKLQEGKQLMKQLIYRLNEKESAEVKKYIKDNLQKDYIRELILLAEYSILFAPKKDRTP
ncbi:uncharacterized protein CIMG_12609 [Coccidioides immitis RS]|uniref:Uncharacterized protein n=1 Tax=Coccidioides immitis (strain RS) TaxID=246410 RepID=A0A0D8JRM0_COCIM|nr:uncharacterized protein CIMG_12609 [Coccidioides immitis RS]KJF59937.1 hypothetical protein CIMG_12609 [Coccidioides immitis RS]